MNKAKIEVRWIVLGIDGRHVSLGRYSDPTSEEIDKVEAMLHDSKTAGWLAVMKGDYYSPNKPSLLMIRPLADPQLPWEKAVHFFEEIRTNHFHRVG